jgi:hypothetical protein
MTPRPTMSISRTGILRVVLGVTEKGVDQGVGVYALRDGPLSSDEGLNRGP